MPLLASCTCGSSSDLYEISHIIDIKSGVYNSDGLLPTGFTKPSFIATETLSITGWEEHSLDPRGILRLLDLYILLIYYFSGDTSENFNGEVQFVPQIKILFEGATSLIYSLE